MGTTIYDEGYRSIVMQLKAARKRRGLTQAEAARMIGHSFGWWSKWETFQIRIDVVQFVRLCEILGLNSGRLIRMLEKG